MCEAVELPPPGPVLHETAAEVAVVDAPVGEEIQMAEVIQVDIAEEIQMPVQDLFREDTVDSAVSDGSCRGPAGLPAGERGDSDGMSQHTVGRSGNSAKIDLRMQLHH